MLALLAAVAVTPGRAGAAVDQCLTCHQAMDSPEAKAYQADIHRSRGVSCADCHGGDATSDDPDIAMSKAKGFIGVPGKQDIPTVCGRCHGGGDNAFTRRFHLADEVSRFRASVHSEALASSPNGPQCVSCHGVHNIAAVSDARSPASPGRVVGTCSGCHSNASYMRDFNPGLPVDQHEKYLTSVHGQRYARGDLKVATCVSCHSNHDILAVKDPRAPTYASRIPETCAHCHSDAKYMAAYNIPTDQYDKYRTSVHGVALLQNSDLNAPACNDCHGNHGAAPPGAASVIAVCGQCHQANEENYEKSAHQPVFAEQRLPGCEVCHGNHGIRHPDDSMVGFGAATPCAQCHQNSPTDPAAAQIVHMKAMLDSLSAGAVEADSVLQRAEQLGMDVSDAIYSLKSAHQAGVQAAVAIHSFKVDDLAAAARPGIAVVTAARQAGLAAIGEYHFRRQGLTVATLIVTLVVVLLYLKIRQIERRQKHEEN
jgi:hypothetical protein